MIGESSSQELFLLNETQRYKNDFKPKGKKTLQERFGRCLVSIFRGTCSLPFNVCVSDKEFHSDFYNSLFVMYAQNKFSEILYNCVSNLDVWILMA